MVQQKPVQQSNVTFEEVNQLIWKYLVERGWHTNTPRSFATSIAIEAAELLEHYQWSDTPVKDKNEVAHELADVLIYCFEFAQATDIDIAAAMQEKLALAAKKYPALPNIAQKERHAAWQKIHDDHRTNKEAA